MKEELKHRHPTAGTPITITDITLIIIHHHHHPRHDMFCPAGMFSRRNTLATFYASAS